MVKHVVAVVEAEIEEIPDIVKDFQAFQLRKYKKRRKLPELLRNQMGQANLLVAKGDFKQAADICMTVIKEAPSSGQPFKTLSFIYEEQGDKEMSLQYSLISAFLDCKDSNEWLELAKRCSDAGNIKQTLACYDRACKFKPGDLELQWERSVIYFENMDYRKCLDIYQTIIKIIIPSDKDLYIAVARSIAKIYHDLSLVDKAGETIESAFSVCPGFQDVEAVHLLSEVLIQRKQYKRCIKLFRNHSGVSLPSNIFQQKRKLPDNESENENTLNTFLHQIQKDINQGTTSSMTSNIVETVVSNAKNPSKKSYIDLQPVLSANINDKTADNNISVPDDFPVDLRAKLCVSMIYSQLFEYLGTLISPLYNEDIDVVGDLILDIAEAYFNVGEHDEALKHLTELTSSEKYNQAAIWLKIAECEEAMENWENTISAYYQVLSLAPLQVGVRFALSIMLRKVEREEEAMNVLADYAEVCVNEDGMEQKNISDENRLNVEEYTSWYTKCIKMYQDGEFKDFLYHSYILLDNYFMSSYTYQKKQMIGKALIWELMLKTLKVSLKMKENKKAVSIIEKAVLFKPFGEAKRYRLDLDYLLVTTLVVSREYSKAFDAFRILLMHEKPDVVNRNVLWVLFTIISNKMMDKRHHRFTLRYLFRKPSFVPQIIRNGINSHSSGTYKYAIGEFARAFRYEPTFPLSSLLLGVSFLHLSCQKFATSRHSSILQGLIFTLQYMQLRGENQESYYNVGRAFHQVGLVHFAVHYYKKALEFPLYNTTQGLPDNEAEYHPHVDLHREAAFNLSMIYKASGNKDLARDVLRKYCRV